jgi:hypothetical protein
MIDTQRQSMEENKIAIYIYLFILVKHTHTHTHKYTQKMNAKIRE